jgi:signal transduction histidine kinase
MLQRLTALSQRLDRLVDSLLEVSRVSWMPLQRRSTALDTIVDEVLATLDFSLREAGVQVRRPELLPVIACDPIQVSQIYRNLITNASKYNDKPERWIELGFTGPVEMPTLFIRDNGIGIDSRHHEDIFTRFRRLNAADRFGDGSGLGLAIVRKIVERHSGRIWLESAPGEGTTFYFTLAPQPLAQPLAPAAGPE